jgi:ribonuclease HII
VKALPDQNLWKKYKLVAGVDEAGRGPLAGPVVAAAIILPRNYFHHEIDDSKKIPAPKRILLSEMLKRSAIAYAFGIVEADIIDKINILEATKSAMHAAVVSLNPHPEFVLIDALKINTLPYKQSALIKGDTLSISIAAASILAKVHRDAIMCDYHASFPQYRFNQHKGYPTKLHRACIRKYGSCPIHRKSFKLL